MCHISMDHVSVTDIMRQLMVGGHITIGNTDAYSYYSNTYHYDKGMWWDSYWCRGYIEECTRVSSTGRVYQALRNGL